MAAPVVHVEVRGLDQAGLAAFYRDTFGWEWDTDLSVDGYSIAELGTVRITAAAGEVPEWQAHSCTFYIQVENLDQAIEQIEAAGGRAVMPKTVGPDDFPAQHINTFTTFVDPAGNVVGLVEAPKGDIV